jgi:hypothetical protein
LATVWFGPPSVFCLLKEYVMTKWISTPVRISLGLAFLPILVTGCVQNLGASVAATAADTFVATIAAAIANAIAGQIVPVAQ